MASIYWSLLTLSSYLNILKVHAQTTLSFCNGDKVFSVVDQDCAAGINFGDRKPDCVCITGLYRSWAKDCEIYDGFTHEFCSPLTDDNFQTSGIRLVGGVSDIYTDTAAVFGLESEDYRNWKAYLIGSEGETKSDSFYTLNGFPVMLSKGSEKFICVAPKATVEQQVCRFFVTDNRGIWSSESGVKIKVMQSCETSSVAELSGFSQSEFKEHRCYDIMGKNVSECQLSCEGGDIAKPKPKTKRPKVLPPPGSEVDYMTGPSEEIDLSGNANFYLHRKLNKYVRMRQVGLLPRPDLSKTAPNRTFTLLDIAKRVVRGACPARFVSDIFIEQALELFVMLHKGQDFRFIEDIEARDFKWIEEILLTCRVEMIEKPLTVEPNEHLPSCQNDGLIEKTCFVSPCEEVEGGMYHQSGKYHFVIDAIWNIIDMTHVLCQPNFSKSFRMFHVWEQASEKLFTRDIKTLWYKPEVDLKVYDALLSPKAVVDMINLERCTEAAYKVSAIPRLVRPPKPRRNFRRKRSVKSNLPSMSATLDVYCAKKEEEYQYDC